MKLKRDLPVLAIMLGSVLFMIAAARYPGGTVELPGTSGYSVVNNFVSSLFGSRALNGELNPARFIAIAALLSLCLGLAVIFNQISKAAGAPVQRKTIQIGGIGAMVYTALVATPMHDLMVTIGLGFLLAALLATAGMLFQQRQWLLFGGGVIFIGLKLISATVYYGDVFYQSLAVLQKVSIVVGLAWIVAVYYHSSSRSALEIAHAQPGQREPS